ncbi:MAG: hypothetical protein RL662_547 [Bacteroidota bacterium]|jgi:predicted DNA-binding protein (MmcQ/YjbR family)
MNIEEVREYCLQIIGAEESFPFDEVTIVFKIMGKMFALMSLERGINAEFGVNLKCDPELSVNLREKYECVFPGYHMNKKYWNTVSLEGDMSAVELQYWINHSVEEVIKKLPKKQQAEYAALKENRT